MKKAVLVALVFMVSTACGCAGAGVEESVAATAAVDDHELRACRNELTGKQAEYKALKEAYDANSETLRAILGEKEEMERRYQAALDEQARLNKQFGILSASLQEMSTQSRAHQDYSWQMQLENEKVSKDYTTLLDQLVELKAGNNETVSTNFTAAEQEIFYQVFDKVYPEIVEGLRSG